MYRPSILALLVLLPKWSAAEVVTDGTMATGSIVKVGANYPIPHTLGRNVGNKSLFHSFTSFNLAAGESATFTGPADFDNVFARVTGGASTIKGTLRSSIGSANLYFINPKGVFFGPRARLDVQGAVTITTADFVELEDGARFSAIPGPTDVGLTSAPVAAFGFLQSPAGRVSVAQTTQPFIARPGSAVMIVAGDIDLADGAEIDAGGGELSLISVGAPNPSEVGRVELQFASPASLPVLRNFATGGSVTMQPGATLRSNAPGGGGRVVIRGGKLTMIGAAVDADVTGEGDNRGADIAVSGLFEMKQGSLVTSRMVSGASGNSGGVRVAAGALRLEAGSTIDTTTFGTGSTGPLSIDAGDVQIDGGGGGVPTGLFADSDNTGTAGGISLRASGSLSATGGGEISSRSLGVADAGPVSIQAATAIFDNAGTQSLRTSINTGSSSTGSGGKIDVEVTGALTLRSGAEFTASTIGPGDSGSIVIRAGSILLDGTIRPELLTGFTVESRAVSNGGDAGPLKVQTSGLLQMQGTGIISGGTFGDGDGGPVSVRAGALTIERLGSAVDFIGITALSRMKPGAGLGGQGGNLDVQVDGALTLRNGGLIDSSTFGIGAAGNVTVSAGSIAIDRAGSDFFTGIGSDTEAAQGGGPGGNVTVVSRSSLTLDGGGLISTGTFGSGPAGNVSVKAVNITIQGEGTLNPSVVSGFSGIIASTAEDSSGPGGTVSVQAESIEIADRGQITSRTAGLGDGGTVTVRANRLAITSEGEINSDTTSSGKGGDVRVMAGLELTITGIPGVESFTGISSDSGNDDERSATGAAGNVFVSAPAINLFAGVITADTYGSGQGGSVSVTSTTLSLEEEAAISATTLGSGRGGDVQVTSGSLRIVGSLSEFETGIVATSREEATGAGGNVVVRVGDLRMERTGLISASTFGPGAGGDVLVSARNLTITGHPSSATGISADSDSSGRGGSGGQVNVIADRLTLLAGGQISATTNNLGAGGDVTLSAGTLRISGSAGEFASGIFADSSASGSGGPSGTIRITASDIVLAAAGVIAAKSSNSGTGGGIDIAGRALSLTQNAQIAALATGAGAAGSIRIRLTGPLDMTKGGTVTSSATQSSAGLVDISSEADLRIDASTITVQALAGNAGSVTLRTPGTLSLRRSQVLAAAGINGGNISIAADELILDGSQISANAVAGNGGQITLAIDADGVLGGPGDFVIVSRNVIQSADSRITASSEAGIQGTLAIDAPLFDLSSSLAELQGALVDTSIRLQERCIMRLGVEASSFLAIGRGGVEAKPEEVPLEIANRIRRAGAGKVRPR